MIDFDEEESNKGSGLNIVVAVLVFVVIGALAAVAFGGFIGWMKF